MNGRSPPTPRGVAFGPFSGVDSDRNIKTKKKRERDVNYIALNWPTDSHQRESLKKISSLTFSRISNQTINQLNDIVNDTAARIAHINEDFKKKDFSSFMV